MPAGWSAAVASEWDAPDAPLDLQGIARAVGALVWIDTRLHAVVGAWVRDEERPELAVALDRAALRSAWRAEVLRERLPELRQVTVASVVVAPAGAEAACDGLAGLAGPAAGDERLAALVTGVLPAERAALAALRDRTTPVADAPLRRWIDLLSADLDADLAALAALGGGGADVVVPAPATALADVLGALVPSAAAD